MHAMATLRQKALVNKIVENKGNVSKSMREVGYSPASAKNPQYFVTAPAFLELMEKAMPTLHLLKKHNEFLNSPRTIKRFKKGDIEEVIEETDSNAVRALDMAYKLKGLYKNNSEVSTTLVINLSPEASQRYAPSIAPVTVPIIDITNEHVIDTPVEIVKEKVGKKVRDNK